MQEFLLNEHTLSGVSHLIPAEYCAEIKTGSLYGVGVVDGEEGVAVFLCREEEELLRILWLYVSPDHRGLGIGPWLLERRLNDARFAGALRGVVADLPSDDPEGLLEGLLMGAGFSVALEESGIYTFSLGSLGNVKPLSLLQRKIPEDVIVPLDKAPHNLRRDAILAVKAGTRPAPLPEPMDWEQYDQNLSALYRSHGQIQGILLISRQERSLSIDFAWTSTPNALLPLLSYSAQRAWDTLPSTTEIIVPAVNELSAQLVEQSLDIRPQQVLRARLSFPAPFAVGNMVLTNNDLRRLDPWTLLVAPDGFSDADLAAWKGGV